MKAGLSFGMWLRQRRRTLDLTQSKLARGVACSVVTVRKLETDERRPSVELAKRLATYLNIEPDQYEHFITFARSDPYHESVPPPTAAEPSLPWREESSEAIVRANNLEPEEPNRRRDWDEAPDVSEFYGREAELAQLEELVVDKRCRLVGVLGMGGIGKTALTTTLAINVQNQFTCVIWRSLRNAPLVEEIVGEYIYILSDRQTIEQSARLDQKISVLINHLRQQRCLLVLDNMETILNEGEQAGHYRTGFEGYGQLLQRIGETQHQSCLIFTSREKPRQLARLEGESAPVRSLQLVSLEADEGRFVLADRGLYGADDHWLRLTERCAGNPLALKIAAETIRELFGGDIAAFLAEDTVMFGGIRDLLTQQFERLSDLERELMVWLVIEREAVTVDILRDNLVQPVARHALLETLRSLHRRSLLETTNSRHDGVRRQTTSGFTLQNVVMEYVTERLVNEIYEQIAAGRTDLLQRYALIKAQSKEYVRASQVRLILEPIVNRLLSMLGQRALESKVQGLLAVMREEQPHQPGYAGGNLLNLLLHMQSDLRGWDFSHLAIWQASLRGRQVRHANFAYVDFNKTTFTDTFSGVFSVAFSPNQMLLAAGTGVGEVRIWNAADGQPILTIDEYETTVCSVCFSPSHNILACGSADQTVRLWNVQSGQCLNILRGHDHWVVSVVFSSDGRMLASSSSDNTARLWDVETGQCLNILQGHTAPVESICFSPTGTLLASGSSDQTIRVWDISTGQCIETFQGHTDWVRSVAFSPDGHILASGSFDQTIRLWDVSTGQCIHRMQGHTNMIWSLVFSPDGRTLASGGFDQTVRLWDVLTGRCFDMLQGYINGVYSVAYSPDGTLLASGNYDRTVRLWDMNTKQCIHALQEHTGFVHSVAFCPDGTLLASGSTDNTIRLWDVRTGNCLDTLLGHSLWIKCVTFSSDGTMFASCSYDQSIRLWHRQGSSLQPVQTLQGHTQAIEALIFSPDSTLLASSSDDMTVRLWDVRNGKSATSDKIECLTILEGHTDWVRSIAFSPNGRFLVSGSEDDTIRLWDLHSLENRSGGVKCLHTLTDHTAGIRSVAFSPDGRIVASGSEDKTIKLWNVEMLESASGTVQCLYTLTGHTAGIRSIAFSPDGHTLVSGSEDETIKLWDVRSGECLETLRSDRPYEEMNITGITGVTDAQKTTLRALGAVEL